MYCIKCGKFVPDGKNFCGHCGAKQEILPQTPVQPASVPQLQYPVPQNYAPAPKKRGLSKGAVIGIIAGASVFVLAFAVILLIGLSNTVGYVGALSPTIFFDRTPDVVTFEEPEEYVFYFSDDLPVSDAVLEYVSILIDDYGMVIREQEVEEGTMIFELGKGASRRKFVRIYCDRMGDGYEVIIIVGEKVMFAGYDVYDWGESDSASDVQEEPVLEAQQEPAVSAPAPTPAPTPTPTPALSYPVLPDLYAFLGGNASVMDSGDYGEHVVRHDYKLGMSDGWEAGQEYAQLLIDDPRFGLSLRESYDVDMVSGPMKVYIFDYVGSGNVEQMSTRYYGNDYVYVDADVLVTVHRSGYGGYGSVAIDYSEDFTMEDFGDRASFVPEGATGESASFSGTDNDYSARTPCPYCDDGDCDKCGGDGYLYSAASGKEDRNCTGAYCSRGSCSYCGGDGWRD